MEETAEKSCWNITVWALAAVLGLAIVISFFSGSRDVAEVSGESAPAVQAASNVSG